MRPIIVVVALLGSVACRDLSLPPPPGVGSLRGRVVAAVPGRVERIPVPGASLSVLGSSLTTAADDAGLFLFDDFEQTSGSLLVRAAVDGAPRQRLLDLSSLGTGPGLDVDLGEVAVVENATLHGSVRRADLSTAGGHGGTALFVPEGPFTTTTGDDGTFVLDGLPAGTISVSAFRTGYAPATVSDLTLRSGEDFALQPLTLQPSSDTTPGSISGRVRFVPPLANADQTALTALAPGGVSTTGSASADGHFSFGGLAPGVYELHAAHAGYTDAVVPSVLVSAGAEVQVSDVVLGTGPAFDAGVRPALDAGTTDAGAVDGGALTSCASTADCPSSAWCDPLGNVCRAQCVAAGSCTDGRVCDLPTGTCVTPCSKGCAAGQTCDSVSNHCVTPCDAFTPCGTGLRCVANRCAPECLVTTDCAAHRACQAGQCVGDGTCGSDLDCPSAQVCTAGFCATRPVVLDAGVDAGSAVVYPCASACDCRADEACEEGACRPDAVPTRYVAADAGGSGDSPATPSGDVAAQVALANLTGGRVALRAGDRFDLAGTLALDGGVTLGGGYTACGPSRWVRDGRLRSTLTAPTGTVVQVAGTVQQAAANVTVENLTLFDTVGLSCLSLLEAFNAPTLTVRHVSGSMPMAHQGCGGANQMGLFECAGCSAVRVDDVALDGVVGTGSSSPVGVVSLTSSSGQLTRVSYSGVEANSTFVAISLAALTGPTSVVGATFPALTAASNPLLGVSVSACGSSPLVISNVHQVVSTGGGATTGIAVRDCPNATVTDNVIDGAGVARGYGNEFDGLALTNSSGVVERNVVRLPGYVNGPQSGTSWFGLRVTGPLAPSSVSSNQVLGGTAEQLTGLWFQGLDSGGPLHVEKNTVSLGDDRGSVGLIFTAVGAGAGLVVRDNVVTTGTSSVGCTTDVALTTSSASGLFERNRLHTQAAQYPLAASLAGPGQLELLENHLFAGHTLVGAGCGGPATGLQLLDGTGPLQVWATGNTIEGNGDLGASSIGVSCTDAVRLFSTSNVIVGGQTPNALALWGGTGTGACFVPANFSHTWLSLSSAAQAWAAADFAPKVADGGVPDARGNVLGAGTCFDPSQPEPRYLLAAGSACIDRGVAGVRLDTTVVTTDLDGNPRVVGAAADIGCSEHP